MAEFTFLIYDTALNAFGGEFTYDPAVNTTGNITVEDANDSTFHDVNGGIYTNPVATPTSGDPDGVGDQTIVSNDLDPAANGQTIDTNTHVIVTGSDGSEFVGFHVITNEDGSSNPWGAGDGFFAFQEALVPGVTYTLSSPDGTDGTASGGQLGNASVAYAELADTPVCFCAGTMIETDQGDVAVEDLAEGMMVRTRDNGLQSLRWVGNKVVDRVQLNRNEKLRAVCIKAGALGNGFPVRDMRVSRQHRILVTSKIAERMFGDEEVLVAAIRLTALPGVYIDEDAESVTYYHLLFNQHEIVYAEGSPSESLFTGPQALKSLGAEARQEIFLLFPELAGTDYLPCASRLIPQGKLQKRLIERHLKNNKPLFQQNVKPEPQLSRCT